MLTGAGLRASMRSCIRKLKANLQENMTRPNASEDMRSMRRLVTKPSLSEFDI
jgi:hypothetical protein